MRLWKNTFDIYVQRCCIQDCILKTNILTSVSFSISLLCYLNLLCASTEGSIPQFQNPCGFRHSYGRITDLFYQFDSFHPAGSVLSCMRFVFSGNCHLTQIVLFSIIKFLFCIQTTELKKLKIPSNLFTSRLLSILV